jgi:hypothetical protein
MPIYVFGDSHARANFAGAPDAVLLHQNSVTMHRVGRDGHVINLEPRMATPDSVAVLSYGEVDCRCHVGKQVALGRDADEVCRDLADRYFATLDREMRGFGRVVLAAITPTTRQAELEAVHGPITHEFPFVGTDAARVSYTTRLNGLLRQGCAQAGYTYLDWTAGSANADGTLDFALSDSSGHVKENGGIVRALRAALRL